LALAAIKGFIGFVAASRALLASGLYSINDVASAIAAMVSLRVARRPPSQSHRYGYGKAEFIAVGIVSVVLLFAVVFILAYAIVDVVKGVLQPPHLIAALVALVTMATNEFLARRGFCAAARLGSPMLRTSAEHNRADAISSAATVIGVGGAAVGLHAMDPLVAIFETVHIVWLSGTLLGSSLRGLMDSALSPDQISAIRRACERVVGVVRLGRIRSRQAGPMSWVDIEIDVAGTLTEGHRVRADVCRSVDQALGRRVKTQVILKAARVDATAPQPARRCESHA